MQLSVLGQILLICLFFINLLAFLFYGLDKWKARRGAWRIPEKVLLTLAGIGGALGALLGMLVFHHKTRKRKFSLTVPLLLLLWIILIVLLRRWFTV